MVKLLLNIAVVVLVFVSIVLGTIVLLLPIRRASPARAQQMHLIAFLILTRNKEPTKQPKDLTRS